MLGRSKLWTRARTLAEFSVAATLAGAPAGCGDQSATQNSAWPVGAPPDTKDGGTPGQPGVPGFDAGSGGAAGSDGSNPTGPSGSGHGGAGGVPTQQDGGDPIPVSNDPGGKGGTGGGGNGDGPSQAPAPGALAHDVTISQIALYQAVKIPLMKDGSAVTPLNAPIVKNRPGLLRVFVRTAAGFAPRDLAAVLSLQKGAAKNVILHVSQASTDDSLTSTFDFDLSADDLAQDWSYSVSLHEVTGANNDPANADPAGTDDASGATWPASGTSSLSPQSSGDAIDLVFVPFQYGGDGSQRLPDTSDAQIEYLTQKMFATYPVAKVSHTLHAPLQYGYVVNAQNGWSGALNALCALRRNDAPPVNTYYYGLIAPSASIDRYCGSGCVTGIAVLSEGADDTMRCAMGLGYTGKASGVFLQEVAHNHGRQHAPCGSVSQVDQGFPYPSAKIGVWGYDLVNKQLVDPTENVDFMSYCSPVWISDYTYSALFKRITAVNQLAGTSDRSNDVASLDDSHAGRVITVETDGAMFWGDAVAPRTEGPRVDVVVKHRDGTTSTVPAEYKPHSQGEGAMVVIPEAVAGTVTAVQLPGKEFREVTAAH